MATSVEVTTTASTLSPPPEVSTELHVVNRQKLIKSLQEHLSLSSRPLHGFVFLQGGEEQTRYCTDHTELFSDEHGDRPRPLPTISELKRASDLSERTESPSWDYDEEGDCWKWERPPPPSRKRVNTGNPEIFEDGQKARRAIRKAEYMSVKEKLLKEFICLLCKNVMTLLLTTPCAYNFCKPCLEGKFAGQAFTKERSRGGRTLRSQKNVMKCPACPHDISEFL